MCNRFCIRDPELLVRHYDGSCRNHVVTTTSKRILLHPSSNSSSSCHSCRKHVVTTTSKSLLHRSSNSRSSCRKHVVRTTSKSLLHPSSTSINSCHSNSRIIINSCLRQNKTIISLRHRVSRSASPTWVSKIWLVNIYIIILLKLLHICDIFIKRKRFTEAEESKRGIAGIHLPRHVTCDLRPPYVTSDLSMRDLWPSKWPWNSQSSTIGE